MKLERVAGISVTGLMVGLVIVQSLRLHGAQLSAWAADSTARNERARSDTTRRELVQVGSELVAVSSRLVEQVDVRRKLTADTGRLAQAIRTSESGRIAAVALVGILGDSLHRLQQGLAIVSGDTVRAADTLDALATQGVKVTAAVIITGAQATQPPPLPASWTWDLERPAVEIGVAFRCRGRDAAVQVAGPPWLPVDVRTAGQDTDFCNPKPAAWAGFSFQVPSAQWILVLLAAGYLAGRLL